MRELLPLLKKSGGPVAEKGICLNIRGCICRLVFVGILILWRLQLGISGCDEAVFRTFGLRLIFQSAAVTLTEGGTSIS